MKLHERLYALASESEPDAAKILTECGDAARDMLAALIIAERDQGTYVDSLHRKGPRMAVSYAQAGDRLAVVRAAIVTAGGE